MPDNAHQSGLEAGLLAALKDVATSPAARGLMDDCAVLDWPLGLQLVATQDMLIEGVHFTSQCPPADIGWKLAAVNLSDLAANAARPVAVLMGAGIGQGRDADWAKELLRGMQQALQPSGARLIGGDTVRTGAQTALSITALGSVPVGQSIARSGGQAGDDLWLSGDIGAAGLGLQVALGTHSHGEADTALLRRYRRPQPRNRLGLGLRGLVHAMIDVSDGLLIDAQRLARASGLQAHLQSEQVPLSPAVQQTGVAVASLAAMGDDYELLFAAPPGNHEAIIKAASAASTRITRIGTLQPGDGVLLDGKPPAQLGYQHF